MQPRRIRLQVILWAIRTRDKTGCLAIVSADIVARAKVVLSRLRLFVIRYAAFQEIAKGIAFLKVTDKSTMHTEAHQGG